MDTSTQDDEFDDDLDEVAELPATSKKIESADNEAQEKTDQGKT